MVANRVSSATDKVFRIYLSVMKRMDQFVRPGQARYQVGRIGQNQSCKVVRDEKDRCESQLIIDWNVSMKSKKKQKKLRGHFLARHALWAEVKHASEFLQQSHFRAFSLYEDISDLQVSISNAVVHLEELVKATDEEDMNLEQQKKNTHDVGANPEILSPNG